METKQIQRKIKVAKLLKELESLRRELALNRLTMRKFLRFLPDGRVVAICDRSTAAECAKLNAERLSGLKPSEAKDVAWPFFEEPVEVIEHGPVGEGVMVSNIDDLKKQFGDPGAIPIPPGLMTKEDLLESVQEEKKESPGLDESQLPGK
jgi:hypothetical protein